MGTWWRPIPIRSNYLLVDVISCVNARPAPPADVPRGRPSPFVLARGRGARADPARRLPAGRRAGAPARHAPARPRARAARRPPRRARCCSPTPTRSPTGSPRPTRSSPSSSAPSARRCASARSRARSARSCPPRSRAPRRACPRSRSRPSRDRARGQRRRRRGRRAACRRLLPGRRRPAARAPDGTERHELGEESMLAMLPARTIGSRAGGGSTLAELGGRDVVRARRATTSSTARASPPASSRGSPT